MSAFVLENFLFLSFALFAAGGVSSLLFEKFNDSKAASSAAHLGALLGSLAGLIFGIAALLAGETLAFSSGISLGMAGPILSLRIDALSAFMLCVISGIALAASLYGESYLRHFYRRYRLGHFGFFFNLFIASMFLVASAGDALLFLFAWELMSIASYFLVIFERDREENVRAGVLYILVTQLGSAFLFAAFLLLQHAAGSWSFDAMRETLQAGALSPVIQNSILALALVGFGAKAGIIPLHVWLPEAHPAAPSHVSALMSGVMIKTAIFMLIRIFIDFFPVVSPWWGLLILALGAMSSLLGVLYALSEHDIKRLLAFHSVENIGIILLGVGASITFFSFGLPIPGIIALAAGLYHIVNHAIFKGLLFLSAGSVVHATGTRNMEEYGGLIKKMPWTAGFFLIGSMAISGLPPLNGFVSEWLTFQSLFAGIAVLPFSAKIIFLVGASSLAFTGGLAAACFVKAFGATFLARARLPHEHVHESSMPMRIGMALLASLAVAFGIGAATVAPLLASIAAGLRGLPMGNAEFVSPLQAIGIGDFSALSIGYVAAALMIGALAATALAYLAARRRSMKIVRTWDCGTELGPRMEITATGFSRSIITIFQRLLRPTMQTSTEYHDAKLRYFTKAKTVSMHLPDLYRAYLYLPAASFIERSARRARLIQTGNLNTYLLYMFITLLLLLYIAFR